MFIKPSGEMQDPNAPQVTPEKLIALKIVEHYRKIFDYLDSKDPFDLIDADELSLAYREFGNFNSKTRLAKD
jgi:hypothetical protein